MKLTRIEIENYRCFGRAELDLTHPETGEPLDLVVIAGDNGSGKSSLLRALGYLVGSQFGAGAEDIVAADVRGEAAYLEFAAQWRWQPTEGPAEIVGARYVRARIACDVRGRKLSRNGEAMGDWDFRDGQAWRRFRGARSQEGKPPGVIVAFDVHRLLPASVVSGPDLNKVPKRWHDGACAPTVSKSGGIHNRFGTLKQWIVNLDYQRVRAKANHGLDLPLWDRLRTALNRMVTPWQFAEVDDKFDVYFDTPNGRVPIEALSDGLRSLFVIVTELLFRFSLANPDPEAILDTEAVCLIDEIDAHLHPRWQLTVLPTLRSLFPNVQFIVTTHAPLVLATAAAHEIFRLEDEPERPEA